MSYISDPADWPRVAARVARAGICGLDSEFYNVDLRRENCIGRSKIHVWSIAVRSGRMGARGFERATGVTLPVAALECPEIRAVLENPDVIKCIHNLPVDAHSFKNHGITIQGGINTLSLARWMRPDLPEFGLKFLMPIIGRKPVGDFSELFRRPRVVTKFKTVVEKGCECMVDKCRKRSTGHAKWTRSVPVEVKLDRGFEPVPLQEIVPGHPLFKILDKYAAEDAEAALEWHDYCETLEVTTPNPFHGS